MPALFPFHPYCRLKAHSMLHPRLVFSPLHAFFRRVCAVCPALLTAEAQGTFNAASSAGLQPNQSINQSLIGCYTEHRPFLEPTRGSLAIPNTIQHFPAVPVTTGRDWPCIRPAHGCLNAPTTQPTLLQTTSTSALLRLASASMSMTSKQRKLPSPHKRT